MSNGALRTPQRRPRWLLFPGQIMLSNIYYKDPGLFGRLISANTAIKATESGGQYVVDCPENLNPKSSKVVIRPDPEAIYPMILAGDVDYAFGYMGSVIGEGPAGIKTLALPPQINLSDLSLVANTYNRVTINIFSDKLDRRIGVKLGAKANGLTIPLNAPNKEAPVNFLLIFLSETGAGCPEGSAYYSHQSGRDERSFQSA